MEEFRQRIKQSPWSQRQVETKAGFSRGYLSQLLAGNLDLKVWHVLAILEVLEHNPGEVFAKVFPPPRRGLRSLDEFAERSQPLNEETDELLAQLYDRGVESLEELRGRIVRCERAVAQLEELGLLRSESGRGRS